MGVGSGHSRSGESIHSSIVTPTHYHVTVGLDPVAQDGDSAVILKSHQHAPTDHRRQIPDRSRLTASGAGVHQTQPRVGRVTLDAEGSTEDLQAGANGEDVSSFLDTVDESSFGQEVAGESLRAIFSSAEEVERSRRNWRTDGDMVQLDVEAASLCAKREYRSVTSVAIGSQ